MSTQSQNPRPRKPNLILILCDDLGYGDLSCYGNQEFETPRLDQMAREGVRFTDFYAVAPICSPSRAAIMTGRYPSRVGINGVLFPDSVVGLHASELSLGDLMKRQGYATGYVGKWHLGDTGPHMPWCHGFDYYCGVPYSNDMNPLPVYQQQEVVDSCRPDDQQRHLTELWAQQACKFLEENAQRPFFLQLANTAPHEPVVVSESFEGKTGAGPYGDLVYTIDWGIGQVLDKLRALGLEQDTLVVFTSDNGPWFKGSASNFRGRKFTTWEGGIRMPTIARWPGRLPAGQVQAAPAMMPDLLPTFVHLAGGELPTDRALDGEDILRLMECQPRQQRDDLMAFAPGGGHGERVFAYRWGKWKLHFATFEETGTPWNHPQWGPFPGYQVMDRQEKPVLYDLEADPGETTDGAEHNPKVVRDFLDRVRPWEEGFVSTKAEERRAMGKPSDEEIGRLVEERKAQRAARGPQT